MVSSTCARDPVFWSGGVEVVVSLVRVLVLNGHAEGCTGTHSVSIGAEHLRCKHWTRSPIAVLLSFGILS